MTTTVSELLRAAREKVAMGFTPGPWAVGFSDGSGASEETGFTITAGDHAVVDQPVIVVRSGKDDWGVVNGIRDRSNAMLISAAPDLLDAVKKLLSDCEAAHRDLPTYYWNPTTVIAARAAICKAEGDAFDAAIAAEESK